MKIIVMSDSHGSYAAVQSIMDRTADADMFIFLGDGEREVEKRKQIIPTEIYDTSAGTATMPPLRPRHSL